MRDISWLLLGSALGGIARHWLSTLVEARTRTVMPWGTITVNVSGAFLIGIVAGAAVDGSWLAMPAAWRFLVIGLLGSYTTVSSFSLQTLLLIREGEPRRAAANVALSVASCLAVAWLGLLVAARMVSVP
jgi:fluoride exporter